MGIRTLHRTAPPRTGAEGPACVSLPSVPVVAPDASTARIPETFAPALRQAAAGLRRRLAHRRPAAAGPGEPPAWRLWAELARGYLALALTRLPRHRPAHTFTVFVATAGTADAAGPVSARPGGSGADRRRPGRPGPGPDAAP
ncbi:hypothetical protein TU94_08595 [Streptomyces cyaneogriseus subsp. noncyanogenus]|uniref:Uncharacterized protein n=1 Tax=Streptomyces cyaneogriseus subsp. noncyanogenus TaxID=477245 RepID=A0A0C5GBK8_9ACTN|nr:hypothetical protein [Streptomyces cyaneogriseus]AJP01546.1 hypothetical protein TU94_08595 [Streptomyces cyaneogriseus subsp. noncyanogenus]